LPTVDRIMTTAGIALTFDQPLPEELFAI